MDEFNPYASPVADSGVVSVDRSSGRRLYLILNLVYAVLVGIGLLFLLLGGSISLALADLLVVGIFLAPLLSFWLVMANYARVFRYWRFVQALIAGVLLLFCLVDLGRGALVGVGLFMALVNVLSLIFSSHFYLLNQRSTQLPGGVQSG